MANILHTELKVVTESATPGYGAALLAALADGVSEKEAVSDRGRCMLRKKYSLTHTIGNIKNISVCNSALKNIMQE